MRYSPLVCLASALLLLLPGAGKAQPRIRLRIESVQVGFGPSPPIAEFKSGFWTPVYVTVMAGPEGTPKGDIIVESVDSDEVPNRYTAVLPQLGPNEQETILAFTKPGSMSSDITVRARIDDRIVASNESPYAALGLDQQLLLSVGSGLTGLRAALNPAAKGVEDEAPFSRDNAPRRLAVVDDVRMLPNRWFGYESLDLLILSTGNRDFLTALLNEREGRKDAIADWVRRGGRILISVGHNQDMVSKLEPLQAVLPMAVDGMLQLPRLRSIAKFSGPQYAPLENAPAAKNRAPLAIAKLTPKPGRETETVLAEQDGPPLIVKGAYGLGRVTVVALDLDQQSAFGKWDPGARKDFWTTLLRQTAPPLPAQSSGQPMAFNRFGNPQGYDLASQLHDNLEDFEDVPVISFGWVALFILLYILVVGPLDYIILKKVFKRLEWTWITFPSVVLIVSAAAYFTAYAVKGNDLKINKIDLIDLDMRSDLDAKQQPLRAYAYGTTWFTILSPRIQNYTVGIGPGMPGAGKKVDLEPSGVLVSWLGRPENVGMGGMGRQRSQGLFRRAYEYAADAAGLQGVPIPVWSTKTFTASWEASLPKLPFRVDLRYNPADPKRISGTIQSKLSVPLEDVWVYYGGQWFPIAMDEAREGRGDKAPLWKVASDLPGTVMLDTWIGSAGQGKKQWPPPANQRQYDPTLSVKTLLFAQGSNYAMERNHSFRRLDQSWRLSTERWQGPGLTREAILFARLPRAADQPPQDSSLSIDPALWLGELPGEGKILPPLPGSLIQDTYLRAYLPVTPAQP
jgi:hypothetical protein